MYKEINDLFMKARKGDVTSKEKLLQLLKPLILSSIRKYYYRKEELEDLIQEGNLVILECIESFDEEKGVFFLGYVKTILRYSYLNKNREKVHSSLNTPLGDDETGELIDLIESKEDSQDDILIKREDMDNLDLALLKLTQRQRQIVELFYLGSLDIDSISRELGISYRTVVNTKTRALEKMREFFLSRDA